MAVLLIAGQHVGIVEQVGRGIRRVHLSDEGTLVLGRHRLRPILILVKLPILCREVIVLLPRVVAVATVLALPGLHPGARPGAVVEALFATQKQTSLIAELCQ